MLNVMTRKQDVKEDVASTFEHFWNMDSFLSSVSKGPSGGPVALHTLVSNGDGAISIAPNPALVPNMLHVVGNDGNLDTPCLHAVAGIDDPYLASDPAAAEYLLIVDLTQDYLMRMLCDGMDIPALPRAAVFAAAVLGKYGSITPRVAKIMEACLDAIGDDAPVRFYDTQTYVRDIKARDDPS